MKEQARLIRPQDRRYAQPAYVFPPLVVWENLWLPRWENPLNVVCMGDKLLHSGATFGGKRFYQLVNFG
jgi:hypothetical protein